MTSINFSNADELHTYCLELFSNTLRIVAHSIQRSLVNAPSHDFMPVCIARILHNNGIANSVSQLNAQLPKSNKLAHNILTNIGYEIIKDAHQEFQSNRVSALMLFFAVEADIVIAGNPDEAKRIAHSGKPLTEIPDHQNVIIIMGGTYNRESNLAYIPISYDKDNNIVPGEIVYTDYDLQKPEMLASQVVSLYDGVLKAYAEFGWISVMNDIVPTVEDKMLFDKLVRKTVNQQMKANGRLN